MSSQLIQSLRQPGVLGSGQSVELVETHISYVLLTGEFAYKIKKPVNLGFVDFSTLEKRLHFCLEEVRLNRRLAPELYLGVIRITGSSRRPQLGGPGQSLEFAVKMKQFPREKELRNIFREGDIPAEYFKILATDLVRFHDQASTASPGSEFASYEALRQRTMDNFQEIRKFTDSPETLRRVKVLQRWSSSNVHSRKASFQKRKTDLRVRECHGDLHLGNLVLIENRIVPFDCLEFNESFRWIDIASEIAFLVMDLCAHNGDSHARRFLNWYLEMSGDYEILALFPHYLVYRAMVLAKVACLRGNQGLPDSAPDTEFMAYLKLAESFVRQKNQKCLIITHGLSGCGKTWLSDRLIERTTLVRIRSDIVRKQCHDVEISSSSDSGVNAGIYSKDATRKTYGRLGEIAVKVLEAGYPVIIDATFLHREYRQKFREIATELCIPFHILDLYAPESVLARRIVERNREKNDASEADLSVLENQIRHSQPLEPSEKGDTVNIKSDIDWTDESFESVINELGLF